MRVRNRIKVLVLSLVVLVSLLTLGIILAHSSHIERWYWEVPSGDEWLVRWNSAFEDNQTTYPSFPSDTRQRLRDSYYQWDNANVSDSDLTIDEVYSWGNTTDHETHPASFEAMRWGDIPGMYHKIMKSDTSNSPQVEKAFSWLNTDWNWITEENDRENRKADVQTVQVHEFGHPTGFGHPCITSRAQNDCDPSTVMAIIFRGTKRVLTEHDKDAMADKY